MRTQLLVFRKLRKLTQGQLAEKLGISRQVYQHIEKGDHNPRFDTMEKFERQYPEENVWEIFKNEKEV